MIGGNLVNANCEGVSMKVLERWVESIPMRMEFPIVMLWAFGYSFGSVLYTLISLADTFIFTSATAISILVAESIILLTLGWFLRQRGWTLARLGLVPSWRSTLMGIALMPIAYIVYALIFVMLPLLVPAVQTLSQIKSISISGVELWQMMLIALLNPIFEEVFVCGYTIQWLKKYNHIAIAVMISATIRAAYHLYQPIPSAIGIWGIGLVFGSFYARTNRLWAVVVAHAIFDLWGLLGLPRQ
jgi:uncharacterized protein